MGAARKRNLRDNENFKMDLANFAEKYYNQGYDDGVEDTKNSFKSAISDGLRKGSSECGRILRERFRK